MSRFSFVIAALLPCLNAAHQGNHSLRGAGVHAVDANQSMGDASQSIGGNGGVKDTNHSSRSSRNHSYGRVLHSAPIGQYWWQQGGWNMRSISLAVEAANGKSFSDLLDRVGGLCDAGVSVLTLLSSYDSGIRADGTADYPPDNLFNGLAISNLMELNQVIGTWDNWDRLVKKVRDCNMKLFTWLNPSYVWAGAKLYTDPANVDMFKWCDNDASVCGTVCAKIAKEETSYPWPEAFSDNALSEASGCDWVTDDRRATPDAYFSVWSGQPSGDFAQEQWRSHVAEAIAFWIGKGIDGFVLDDPTRYVNIGESYDQQDPEAWMAEAITTPAHTFAGKEGFVPLFGETYLVPELVAGFKLDGGLGTKFGDAENSEPIYDAINAKAGVDRPGTAEPSFRGVDAVHAQCLFREDGWCAIAWQRMAPRVEAEWEAGNPLAQAVSAAAGYFTAVESAGDGSWWQATQWPGEDDLNFKGLLHAFRQSSAFRHLSMRAPAYSNFDGGDIYGMVRYDAFCTGMVGLFAANLGGDDSAAFHVEFAMSPIVRKKALAPSATWMLGEYSFKFQEFGGALPTWYKEGSHLNCFDSSTHQFKYGGVYEMTLGACLLSCIGDDNSHGKGVCKQVTVEWLGGEQNGKVNCWGHDVIASSDCKEECGDKCYSTFTFQDAPQC